MREIAGRYRPDEELGRGGMGVVWKAWDARLRRHVAVKRLLVPAGASPADRAGMRRRFLREARAAAGLEHPSIIGVHDVVEEPGGDIWMVMEYVQGRSLEEAAKDGLPAERVAAIGLDLLGALRTAHGAGVMHRDVKPANVLVTDAGRTVLTDFGIAAVADGSGSLTADGAVIGSAGYVAPERYDEGTDEPEADLWSLGATLYYAAEGKRAYAATSMRHLIGQLFSGRIPEFERSGPLAPVIEGLLQRDVADRWDAATAEKALKAIADGATTSMPAPSPEPPALTPALSPATAPDAGGAAVRKATVTTGKKAGSRAVGFLKGAVPVVLLGLGLLYLNHDRLLGLFDGPVFASTPPGLCNDVDKTARNYTSATSTFTREQFVEDASWKKTGEKEGYRCTWGEAETVSLAPVLIIVDRYDSSKAAQKAVRTGAALGGEARNDFRVDNIAVAVLCQDASSGRDPEQQGCADEIAAAVKARLEAQRP
ncbi:serine/threonine-protein kinase [Actinomadura verrucosospora]|uniref:non-specific serine/threonine protein kinase n=1 Tax=Actinomadura verrucosospora TaxID=46165 RepID=A0A7D3VVR8_ACTVE|nr:serine/threonine-protein kinase [Actinomadura verrucosospora]QKG24019.1 hypothetical protein ACTIVE_5662 [Actinomadura verrucosospora]